MENQLWWHTGIIYQVYPRSFQDSNADGVGDLKGVHARLDYLQSLGINALWLSPIYPSPMKDFGYDISDYIDIHPLFGTLKDFDELLQAAHDRGIKLIMDLVPNHTSDQHPWFLESKSSKNSPKRDWYIWKDANPDGSEPNNWKSVFGGSAWEWDEQTKQFYYHGFLKEQPDLNWRNPAVKQAMLDVMKFWLDRGVDGFRIDVIWHIFKDRELRDNPVNPDYTQEQPTYDQLLPVFSTDQPEVHEVVKEMRCLLDKYDERMMIGEVYLPLDKLMRYYGVDNTGAHLPFNFTLLSLPWDAHHIATAIDSYESALPKDGWPNWVLSNHDRPRIASRVGMQQAKVAAVLLLTLRGTPTIYYGDEIGMQDGPVAWHEMQDPQGLNMPDKNLSRDPQRTPMQWNKDEYAGFSTTKPWLPLPRDFKRNNVEVQMENSFSMLALYRKLICLRQGSKSLTLGNYKLVYADSQMIAYTRAAEDDEVYLVLLNFSHRPAYFKPTNKTLKGTVQLACTPELEGAGVQYGFSLAGDEAVIVKINT